MATLSESKAKDAARAFPSGMTSFHREIGMVFKGERVPLCRIALKRFDTMSNYWMTACLGGAFIVREYFRDGVAFSECHQNGIGKKDLVISGRELKILPYATDAAYVFDNVVSHIMTGRMIAKIPAGQKDRWMRTWHRHHSGFTVIVDGILLLNGAEPLGPVPEGSKYFNFGLKTYVQMRRDGKLDQGAYVLCNVREKSDYLSFFGSHIENEAGWRPWIRGTMAIRSGPSLGSFYLHSGYSHSKSYERSKWYHLGGEKKMFAEGTCWGTHELGAVYEYRMEKGSPTDISILGGREDIPLAGLGFAPHPRGILVSEPEQGSNGEELAISLQGVIDRE